MNTAGLHLRETQFDEVFDSQKVFKILLDAMSRPGKVYSLPEIGFRKNSKEFHAPILTILKTLCDNHVTFSVSKGFNPADGDPDSINFIEYIRINTKSTFTKVDQGDFVLFQGVNYAPDFTSLKKGTLEFPEDSATVILTVKEISAKKSNTMPAFSLVLKGPGIKDRHSVTLTGCDAGYLESFSKTNLLFPLGIDLIILDQTGRCVCIPRTTKVEVQ